MTGPGVAGPGADEPGGGGGGEALMMKNKHSFAGTRAGAWLGSRGRSGKSPAPRLLLGDNALHLIPAEPISGTRRFSSLLRVVLIGLIAIGSMGWPNQRCAADVDAAAVQRAIDRGVAYLRKMQNDRGGWDEFAGQSCGLSALCTLAMLNCGVPNDDADIVRAMRYLRSFEPTQTYSVSLQTLVYCQLGAAGDLPRIRRNVEWLMAEQMRGAAVGNAGAWNYGQDRG